MTELSELDSFVFYQTPNSDEIFLLSGPWTKIDMNVNQPLNGFIISNSDKSAIYFLEGKGEVISIPYKVNLNTKSPSNNNLKKEQYLNKAQVFIEACEKQIDKAILSRIKSNVVKEGNNPFNTYLQICKSYNHSFNYFFNIPNIGTWMGATPEILIQGNENKCKTVALAGSKSLKDVIWNKKELEEQQFVMNYIKDKLDNAKVTYGYNQSPETITAGNIAHLKTTFNIETDKNPLELANILHPTPAVCGLPQKEAQEFIKKNEGYDRSFYTGFLGTINTASYNLFVNLRCMQIFKNENWLYIGGGITADSVPDKEWEETELKAQTLLNILD